MDANNWGELNSTRHTDRHYELFNGNLNPENIFGQVDALTEWKEDKNLSSRLFVHTESYEIFKQKNNLFLFGRRGTGKTALVKMLDFEINNELLKSEYNYSKIIYQEDTLFKVTMILRDFEESFNHHELSHVLKEMFIWIIYTEAILAVTKKSKSAEIPDSYLSKMKAFLTSENFIETETVHTTIAPLDRALEILSDCIIDVAEGKQKMGMALLKTLRMLNSGVYKEALNALVGLLNEKKEMCLILIDSQDLYNLEDSVSDSVYTGLIDAVLSIFNQSSKYRIILKVALPSEIVPHLKLSNYGKMNDKEHYIFWKYNDLLKLIARRFCQILVRNGIINEKCDQIKNSLPREFIYRFLPEKTTSYNGIEFDSVAYIVNHTQKKPRELISLFNLILTLAKQNNIPFNKVTPQCIREGTNVKIETLSKVVLELYKDIFHNADRIIKKTFEGSENVMTYGEMHKKLKQALSLVGTSNIEKNDIERLFTESGVIGIVEEIRPIESGKFICEANFEYQIKGTLTLQSWSKLVIHPMFYQELNARVYSNILVSPRPSKNELEIENLFRNE